MKFTVVGANPAGRLVGACLGLARLVGLVGLAAGAQAAVVDAPIEVPGLAAVEAPLPRGGRVLDQALSGDVQAGPRQLDLLLELQRNEAGFAAVPATPSVLPSPQGRPSATAARVAASAVLVPMTPALLGEDVGGPRAELSSARRDWQGHVAGGGGGTTDSGRAGGGSGAGTNASGRVLDDLRGAIQYLRDHLHWLFGGLALLVLGAVVVKIVDRRV